VEELLIILNITVSKMKWTMKNSPSLIYSMLKLSVTVKIGPNGSYII